MNNNTFVQETRTGKILKPLLPLLLSLILLVPMASASTPMSATGSFTATVTITSISQADGNTIITAIETQTLSGFLTGARIATGVEIIHPDGTFNAHDSGTFTGTVNGMSGTAVITGLGVSSRCDHTYDALYQLIRSEGRAHQALLEHDDRPDGMAPGAFRGSRQVPANEKVLPLST